MAAELVDVAVVGTAGRTWQQRARLSAESLAWMQTKVLEQLKAWGLDLPRVRLVSGGSSWADHTAVLLFLEKHEQLGGLRLYFPCAFDRSARRFDETRHAGKMDNPGKQLNAYHQAHSEKVGRSTGNDLVAAEALGAELLVGGRGFHARNVVVARSAYLIAFTFSSGAYPTPADSAGTAFTWSRCQGTKVHFTIPDQPTRKRPSASADPTAKRARVEQARARVVRLRRAEGRVVQGCNVYIGRKCDRGGWDLPESKWANPFTVSACGSAAEAVRRYREWIVKQPALMGSLHELRGDLGCWCKPGPCHGDVLVELLEDRDL